MEPPTTSQGAEMAAVRHVDMAAARQADLTELRQRRVELRETMNAVEAALAAPASGRAVIWGEHVHAAAIDLADDFEEHIAVTEGPGGLHQSILAGDVRLANAVQALTTDHGLIAAEIARLVHDTDPPVTPNDVVMTRERGTAMLAHVARHRQRGADLVYEAYQTDVGGGD